MSVVTVPRGKLGVFLLSRAKTAPTAVKQGLFVGAQLGAGLLKTKSPVYDGLFKNAWKVKKRAAGVELVNDAPYAGIIEAGARPHGVNQAGREAIQRWVARKLLGVTLAPSASVPANSQVALITNAIIKKLRTRGQPGKWIVRDNMDELVRIAAEEVARAMARHHNKPYGSGGRP